MLLQGVALRSLEQHSKVTAALCGPEATPTAPEDGGPCEGPDPGLSWVKQTNFIKTTPAPALLEFDLEVFIIQMTASSLRLGAEYWRYVTSL